MKKKHTTRYFLLSVALVIIIVSILFIEKPTANIPQGEVLGVSRDAKTGIEIGSLAPNFVLRDLNGNLIKLSDLHGKVVVVNFWASWCTFCLEEMPDFETVAQKYKGDVIILGINRGESPEVAQFYAYEELPVGITYPILLDSNEDVSNVYVLRGMPVTYFINKEGIITNRFFGKITLEIMEKEVKKALSS